MEMTIRDVFLSPTMTELLNMAGRQDRAAGVDKYAGWLTVAEANGFCTVGRTPAREAYEDGWFEPPAKK